MGLALLWLLNRFCIIEKFNRLRKKLWEWSFNTYRILESKTKLVESRIIAIKNEVESKSLTDVEYVKLMCLNSKIRKLSKQLEFFSRGKKIIVTSWVIEILDSFSSRLLYATKKTLLIQKLLAGMVFLALQRSNFKLQLSFPTSTKVLLLIYHM